jgi:hypothetical protein
MIAYWPLETAADGLTTPDATPYGNNLNIAGAPVVGAGKFGNAFTFNGSSTYLSILHTSDNSATGLPIYRAGSYTITMWVKGAAQTAKYLFTEGNNSGTNQNVLLILQTGQAAANNAKLDVIIRSDTGATAVTLVDHRVSTNVVFDNTWHHVAWVDDRGAVKLYVDGNPDPANFNYTPAGAFSFNTTTVGSLIRTAVATGNIFNGQMDDLGLWERPLSQAEVQQVMTSSLQAPVPEFPPLILAQPAGATRQLGDRYTFSVRAIGNRPLSYQWFKGVDAIPGANSTSLTLSNLVVADSADYTVQVANLDGPATSTVATLTVLPDPTPNLRQGLVSHWPLDSIETDDLGNPFTPDPYSQNNMKLINSMLFADQVPGTFGDAINFNLNGLNQTNQYGVRSGGFPITVNTAYTVALWVKGNGIGQNDRRFFAESATNSDTPLFGLGTHATGVDGTLRVFIRNDANAALVARNSARAPLDGNWHHVVWTDKNGQARLYIDGEVDETDFFYTRTGTFTLSQTTLGAILRSALTFQFAGALDDVGVWNRALTLTEIQDIRVNGIPPPIGVIPPEITQQPVGQSVLTRSRVNFTFTAIGTGPLAIQWRKGGQDLQDQTNAALAFASVALTDAGDYDVVVANSAGRATSQVATLTVTLRPPAPTSLQVDINNNGADDSAGNTESGFSSFSIPSFGTGPFTKTFGGADLTLTAIGTTMESRKRLVPVDAGSFTQSRLLQDFIFTRDADVSQGLDIAVEFMEANAPYNLTVWSYDNSSVTQNRISDWSANGTLVKSGYTFLGSNLPVDNNTYQFTFTTTSDSDGKILIQGRRSASATGSLNVFVNAIAVVKRELRILRVEVLDFDLSFTIELLNGAATHRIEQSDSLGDPNWTEVTDASFLPPDPATQTQQVFVPIPVIGNRFYRVVQVP